MFARLLALVASALVLLTACAEGTLPPPGDSHDDAGAAGSGGQAGAGQDSARGGTRYVPTEEELDAPRPPAAGADIDPDFSLRLEAEEGELGGDAEIGTDAASGDGYVDLSSSGTISWEVDLDQAGDYALAIRARVTPGYGPKVNGIRVDGASVSDFTVNESSTLYEISPVWVQLQAGTQSLQLRARWGYTDIDWVELRPIDPSYLDVEPTLVTPNASTAARRLMHYLERQYGRKTLSGQQGLNYAKTVYSMVGKYPAVLGVDLIDYSPSRVERQPLVPGHGAVEDAIDWWESYGGIVTVLWHWNAPTGLIDTITTDANGNVVDLSWYRGFYTDATTFDLAAALADPESDDYGLLLRDIDAIADQLERLSDHDIPVLWRPLHEASGGWFWWGASGPDAYLELWHLMFDRLTNVHGLTNLIWVWNGQDPDYYPGDDTVDIVSEDYYARQLDYSPQLGRFGAATAYSSVPKIVALSENGTLLDPDRLAESRAGWSWFCLWSGSDYFDPSYNEASMFEAVYTSDQILTLDELPDLTVYPLP